MEKIVIDNLQYSTFDPFILQLYSIITQNKSPIKKSSVSNKYHCQLKGVTIVIDNLEKKSKLFYRTILHHNHTNQSQMIL